MNQSTIIFGYLFVAFLIFITQRGELPTYWGFLVSSPSTPSQGPTATGSGALSSNGVGQAASKIANLASTLAVF
ncbi:hypothetical protein SOP85_31020 [Pseudomonas sp. YuFO20]|uniref:hypothetical protein n=1 Tax=Bacteria TaxID=2 RepID=UPI002B2472F2|nr:MULTISPECIES: hypothetical protein [Bacteria]MEB2519811.1 hypothetical protein [Pseudomonas sp. YuFO20]MEB2538391.1 hypothetical protein [Micrococcus luteus]MEB2597936.1 hypothetical protein [Corynebacterium amycolatum]MEB2616581.1 hypothetical protein [Bacillus cereus]MEB2619756.1 hypothetical protein [Kocuria rosea]